MDSWDQSPGSFPPSQRHQQVEPDKPDRLAVTGINSQGYGTIAKLVMCDQELTIEAKAIYAYICSYTGGGTTAFPSVAHIVSDLKISEKRFYHHRKALVERGYLAVQQGERVGSTYKSNIYHIVQNVKTQVDEAGRNDGAQTKPQVIGTGRNDSPEKNEACRNDCPQKEPQVIGGGRFGCSQSGGGRNGGTNNGWLDGLEGSEKTFKPLHPTNQPPRQVEDHEEDIKALMGMSLNTRATYNEVEEAYLKAIENGRSPEIIENAYRKYIGKYRDEYDTPRYAMRLDAFLTRGDGLAFFAPRPKAYGAPKRPTASREVPYDELRDYLMTFEEYASAIAEQKQAAELFHRIQKSNPGSGEQDEAVKLVKAASARAESVKDRILRDHPYPYQKEVIAGVR